jgi:hypothetical protein
MQPGARANASSPARARSAASCGSASVGRDSTCLKAESGEVAADGPCRKRERRPLPNDAPTERRDDAAEPGSPEQEPTHASRVGPDVEQRIRVHRRALNTALRYEIGLQPKPGEPVEGMPSLGDPIPDDAHVIVAGQVVSYCIVCIGDLLSGTCGSIAPDPECHLTSVRNSGWFRTKGSRKRDEDAPCKL